MYCIERIPKTSVDGDGIHWEIVKSFPTTEIGDVDEAMVGQYFVIMANVGEVDTVNYNHRIVWN